VPGGTLGRLFALAEAYPDLKASQNMQQFQEELTSTENKVAFARQAFNDSVMSYNNACQNFPSNLIANNFGFKHAEFLEIEQPEKRTVPKVSFNLTQSAPEPWTSSRAKSSRVAPAACSWQCSWRHSSWWHSPPLSWSPQRCASTWRTTRCFLARRAGKNGSPRTSGSSP
jgi:hypothetical protein